MIETKVILDSIGEHSPRLLTIRATSPTMIHQETLRHRLIYIEDQLRGDYDFSFSVSSTRAIPFARTLEDVRSNPAKPVKWGAEQKGMVPGDELTEPFLCPNGALLTPDQAWHRLVQINCEWASAFAAAGHHKSTANRIISTYNHTHCLMTATAPGWLNFFGLRLDKAADNTVRALAEACWAQWNESTPKVLKPDEWHLPFIDEETWDSCLSYACIDPRIVTTNHGLAPPTELVKYVSVARCARLSYATFENPERHSTIEEDLKLYDKLITSRPIHASPAEHQATPDVPIVGQTNSFGTTFYYKNEKQAGNLGPGWIQYRKLLPSEAIAELPEEYRK